MPPGSSVTVPGLSSCASRAVTSHLLGNTIIGESTHPNLLPESSKHIRTSCEHRAGPQIIKHHTKLNDAPPFARKPFDKSSGNNPNASEHQPNNVLNC
eukprot:14030778-Alexandrium_andersonii.AAC.1